MLIFNRGIRNSAFNRRSGHGKGFLPMEGMRPDGADVVVIILSNPLTYLKPVYDPWFLATELIPKRDNNNNKTINTYAPDSVARPMGCTVQVSQPQSHTLQSKNTHTAEAPILHQHQIRTAMFRPRRCTGQRDFERLGDRKPCAAICITITRIVQSNDGCIRLSTGPRKQHGAQRRGSCWPGSSRSMDHRS